ncbi:MAG: hypothetical protein K2Y37_13535 [Pirellulales bacterium]|nr:hypothetical protein [Pirellulales bacterium]
MNRKRLASVVFLGSLAGLALTVGGLLLGNVAVWSGYFPLTVTIDNTTDSAISSIELDAFAHLEQAEGYIAGLRGECSDARATVGPYAGQPIGLRIPTGGRESRVFGETAYVQREHLVVIARWADGTETAKYVTIPNGRKLRSLTVVLP